MITCPVCNSQVPDEATSCFACGTSMEATVSAFPQAPVYETPVQPEAPQAPVFEIPAQPVYEAPAQPTYQAPAQPTYQAPAQPAYQAPVQPTYQAPVQNPYGQPVQPGFQQNVYGQPAYQQPVQVNKASMVLGIVGIVFAWLIAIVGHATSIPGIVLGYKEYKRTGNKTGLILSIIGESCSVLSSLIGILSVWGMMGII